MVYFKRCYMGFIDSIRKEQKPCKEKPRDCKRAKVEKSEGAQMITS